MRRSLVPLLAAAAVAGPLSVRPAAAATGTVVSVEASIDHTIFDDGLHRARFSISCPPEAPCPSAPVSDAVDVAGGTVRKAVLGFDASRASQPRDPPPLLGATEQLDSIHVDLREAGDLTVTLTARPAPGVDPMPVPGSASPGGVVEGRTVTWRLPAAGPGAFDFSARFRAGHSQPAPNGAFVPEGSVELVRESSTLLTFSGGSIPTGQPVTTVSKLTMRQRVSPVTGPPAFAASRFYGSLGSDGLPDAWEVHASADAFGAYAAAAQGDREVKVVGLYEDIAPGAQGANMGANIMTTWHAIGQEGKATPQTGVEIVAGEIVGLSYRMRVQGPRLGAPYGDQLWDGDAVAASGVAGLYRFSRARTGPPADDAGTFGSAWDGALPQGWSALWADDVQGSFHEAGSHVAGANVNWVARDGDVDNRSGTSARTGMAAVIEVPSDQTIISYLAVTSAIPQTAFSIAPTFTANRLTIRPAVGPGGYWLKSTGLWYQTDWTNNTFVMVISKEEGGGFGGPSEDSLRLSGATVVPNGMRGTVLLGTSSGKIRRHAIGPGAWQLSATPAGVLSITRLAI